MAYVGTLADATHFCDKNFIVARNMEFMADEDAVRGHTADTKAMIDIWLLPEQLNDCHSTCHLTLQYGWLLHRGERWKGKSTLRVLSYVNEEVDRARVKENVESMVKRFRLDRGRGAVAEVSVHLAPPAADWGPSYGNGDMLRLLSDKASVVFCTVPMPPHSVDEYDNYLQTLHDLSHSLPPVMMVHGVQDTLSSAM